MHPRLKKIIFDKLYEDLKNVEIIPYKDSIWFIDREKKYWYLEYEKSGHLWWRYQFFTIFFLLFSLEQSEYERVIADWVEEVLNSRVNTTLPPHYCKQLLVEEVLNSRVNTTVGMVGIPTLKVEEVLNSRVNTTTNIKELYTAPVEEVLNSRVNTTRYCNRSFASRLEEALNSRVNTTGSLFLDDGFQTEEVLNYKVDTTSDDVFNLFVISQKAEEALNYNVDTTEENWGDLGIKVKEVINSDKIQQNN